MHRSACRMVRVQVTNRSDAGNRPAKRPRIGLVAPALEWGGGVPSVAEFMCRAIESSGAFEYQLVSLSSAARDEIGVALTRPSSWLRGVGTRREVWQGRPYIRVGAFASEFEFQRCQPRRALTMTLADCDLIQVVCGSPAWALSVCGLGKPVALLCATRVAVERRRRDAVARGPKAAWRRWMTYVVDRLERKALQRVDAIGVMNRWMFEYAQSVNRGPNALIRYVPPGVDTEWFQPLAQRDLVSDPFILCVGRLDDPRKNVGLLTEAFAKLPVATRARVRLVLAGSAGPDAQFWHRVEQLGLRSKMQYIGSPDAATLLRLYQQAAVFVLPSDEEGFGMVLLEAMACGIPVVCTRSGGPDGIITDCTDGYLVPLDDAGAMSARIRDLLANTALNIQMGSAARQAILNRYALTVAGQAFLEVYDQLLARLRQ